MYVGIGAKIYGGKRGKGEKGRRKTYPKKKKRAHRAWGAGGLVVPVGETQSET